MTLLSTAAGFPKPCLGETHVILFGVLVWPGSPFKFLNCQPAKSLIEKMGAAGGGSGKQPQSSNL
jgi:hypothetical protein